MPFVVTGTSHFLARQVLYLSPVRGEYVAQFIHSRLVCNGRFRIHAIEGIGRRKPRVIEVEVTSTRERLHGSATWLAKLVRELETLTSTPGEPPAVPARGQIDSTSK